MYLECLSLWASVDADDGVSSAPRYCDERSEKAIVILWRISNWSCSPNYSMTLLQASHGDYMYTFAFSVSAPIVAACSHSPTLYTASARVNPTLLDSVYIRLRCVNSRQFLYGSEGFEVPWASVKVVDNLRGWSDPQSSHASRRLIPTNSSIDLKTGRDTGLPHSRWINEFQGGKLLTYFFDVLLLK